MELDELKYQLKDKLATDHTGRSNADIAALLNKKTISVTSKLKKSLWFEIYSCIAVILCFGCVSIIVKQNSVRIYFSVFILLAIGFLLIIIYLLQRIKKLSATTLPVKSNLQTIVNIIEDFTRRYFQFTMALIPVCFIFAFWLGYTDKYPLEEIDKLVKHTSWKLFVFAGVYMLLLAVGAYYFTRWYLKKLYGKYIIQLKACIDELKEA
jgi:hypothetical protein